MMLSYSICIRTHTLLKVHDGDNASSGSVSPFAGEHYYYFSLQLKQQFVQGLFINLDLGVKNKEK